MAGTEIEGDFIKTARQCALEVLMKIEKDKSYSNIMVAGTLKHEGLQGADKALFTALTYGTIERKITLDYNLSKYLKQPLKKLNPTVLSILRLGAYQILFCEKIPNRAAINESVELAKKNKVQFASGLVNAVLRKVSESGLLKPEGDKLTCYSIQYSCPKELIKLFIDSYGEENAKGILEHALGPQPLTIRVNTTKITTKELQNLLTTENINALPHDISPDALVLTGVSSIEELKAYKAGFFHVQDASSQICCKKLDVKPGQVVFDVCAAPGGKSFTIAELMENKGTVKSFDMYEHRVGLIKSGAERLGLNIVDAKVGNAEEFNSELGLADRVLCDVPCAGFGIIGRKPEIRYKTLENIDNLSSLQYHILNTASGYLNVDGKLVYSTCSLNPQENVDVVNRFIKEHKNFRLISTETVMPHLNNSDGFFIAVISRTE